jgi:SAM-dependent methyltransferase
MADAISGQPNTGIPIPPARLRFRVHGAFERNGFLNMGEVCVRDIERTLTAVGVDFEVLTDILDFGCGCGRVLRGFYNCPKRGGKHPHTFTGVDIDREAIEWCTKAMPLAKFVRSAPSPPLPFKDSSFDFVYAISVFTHLDENHQLHWLRELKRVLRPRSYLLLTTLGVESVSVLSEFEKAVFYQHGFVFKVFQTGKYKLDGLPDFYQSALQSESYIFHKWSHEFASVRYLTQGMAGHQNVVLLQKP